ncbi:MAG: LysR substrate-binding domain-containing protein [Ascidiaceihabitans sp.]|uniref:LysR family transcriptional regulator n=1 Tax=Rhodobacterales TaxID=204455 RepID=UPI003299BFC7
MKKTTSVSGLSLRDLEYVQSVAQHGNFGMAASVCGVSQPAISQQIMKLEARLGFSIFERQGKHVALTPNGRIVLRKADLLLNEAREFLDLSVSLNNRFDGELKVGVIPTLGPYLLPLILKSLRTDYPNVQWNLFEEPTQTLEQMLADRELDVAFIATAPKQEHLACTDLFFEPFVFASPIELNRVPDSPIEMVEVMQSKLVLLSQEHCLTDQTVALCNLPGLQGQRVASSLEMLRHFVALGEGAALFPVLSVGTPDRFGGLATLHPISEKNIGRQVRLVWRKSDPRTEYIADFGAFIGEKMANSPMKDHLTLLP